MFFKIVTILAKLEGAFRPETPITKAKSMAFSVKQKYEKRSTKTGKKGSRVFGNLQLLLWVCRALFGWETSTVTDNTENWHSKVISVCGLVKTGISARIVGTVNRKSSLKVGIAVFGCVTSDTKRQHKISAITSST